MPVRPKAVLLSPNDVPGDGLQSYPVLQRSLDALSADFQTYFATYKEIDKSREEYIQLPFRQWWWPPARFGYHTQLRARAVVNQLNLSPQDRIVSLHPFSQDLALAIKRRCGAPYVVLVHDLHEGALARPDLLVGFREASKVLCVSQPLIDAVSGFAPHVSLLYPSPGLPLGLEPAFSRGPIGMAGHYCSRSLELAARLNIPIRAVGKPTSLADRPDYEEGRFIVEFVPRFAANDQAIRHVAETCSAFCVVVPSDGTDYETHSFPSKFVDFVRAGLPVILIAGRRSAIGQWALANAWPLYIPDDADQTQFENAAARLRDPETWEQDRARVIALHEGDFSSAAISEQLLNAVHSA